MTHEGHSTALYDYWRFIWQLRTQNARREGQKRAGEQDLVLELRAARGDALHRRLGEPPGLPALPPHSIYSRQLGTLEPQRVPRHRLFILRGGAAKGGAAELGLRTVHGGAVQELRRSPRITRLCRTEHRTGPLPPLRVGSFVP
eukprot:scaffold1097_cov67-Phaeocystis_antarctica.AAC.1